MCESLTLVDMLFRCRVDVLRVLGKALTGVKHLWFNIK